MRTIFLAGICILMVFFATSVSAGNGSGDPLYPIIEGVMGVVPALEDACAAVWLAIPQGQALAGVEWFNNDGTLPFPGLYFVSGVPENPVALEYTHLAAENVIGDSGAWSTLLFSSRPETPIFSRGRSLTAA